jgi:hypothetical protein
MAAALLPFPRKSPSAGEEMDEDDVPPLADDMDDDTSRASASSLSGAPSAGSLVDAGRGASFRRDSEDGGSDDGIEELPAAAPSEMHLAVMPVRRYTTTPDGTRTFEGVGALYLTGSVLRHVTSPDSEWDRCGLSGDSPSCSRSGFLSGLTGGKSTAHHRRSPSVWSLDVATGGVVIWLVRAPDEFAFKRAPPSTEPTTLLVLPAANDAERDTAARLAAHLGIWSAGATLCDEEAPRLALLAASAILRSGALTARGLRGCADLISTGLETALDVFRRNVGPVAAEEILGAQGAAEAFAGEGAFGGDGAAEALWVVGAAEALAAQAAAETMRAEGEAGAVIAGVPGGGGGRAGKHAGGLDASGLVACDGMAAVGAAGAPAAGASQPTSTQPALLLHAATRAAAARECAGAQENWAGGRQENCGGGRPPPWASGGQQENWAGGRKENWADVEVATALAKAQAGGGPGGGGGRMYTAIAGGHVYARRVSPPSRIEAAIDGVSTVARAAEGISHNASYAVGMAATRMGAAAAERFQLVANPSQPSRMGAAIRAIGGASVAAAREVLDAIGQTGSQVRRDAHPRNPPPFREQLNMSPA